ncbi:PSP1-domain-containing protein [Sistotremastrum niveocremeum HHB9708]|uniref:PSP1-domain-containing protein n=1 Tax=Sistotremastrum niveocremeum HHB9708 TaxID=1314777 RepID=A0A164R9H7_9AGAM|nr:PSP1-domain-containing protein [Sistotremastrum niveocremeum HHB9708]
MNSSHSRQPDDSDRRSRLTTHQPADPHALSLKGRAASQPPRTGESGFLSSSPLGRRFDGYEAPRQTVWNPPFGGIGLETTRPIIPSLPGRSASFSLDRAASNQGFFSNQFRGGRSFASTFEDDESEAMSDSMSQSNYENSINSHDMSQSQTFRGRPYLQDVTRSRSQSLAGIRTTSSNITAGPPSSTSGGSASSNFHGWGQSAPLSAARTIGNPYPNTYRDYKPGVERFNSFGGFYANQGPLNENGLQRDIGDISNISPFVRDVGQILEDDGPFRELWGDMGPPRDDGGIPGSGTTSRRHSVSVVQPRRGVLGFTSADGHDDNGYNGSITPRQPYKSNGNHHDHSTVVTEDDLASGLNMLSLNFKDGPGPSSSHQPPSQPSSLPSYGPPGRSEQSRHVDIPMKRQSRGSEFMSSYESSPFTESVSDRASGSPGNRDTWPRSRDQQQPPQRRPSQISTDFAQQYGYEPFQNTSRYSAGPISPTSNSATHRQSGINGQFISPISPGQNGGIGGRQPLSARSDFFPQSAMQQQQQQQHQPSHTNYSQPTRHAQQNSGDGQHLSELGKGVPLHSVPNNSPLFIVEFKAGRTDLFYALDPSVNIRVGDAVIVEADRGKDLGKVINDTITPAELDAWHQAAKNNPGGPGIGDGPISPGGASAKKEIHPKKIYNKAGPQDTQMLVTKIQDEHKALQLCQQKVKQKKLPMEVIDAEYQWDRRKLTFYFVADKRIDFRELVRELFRLYKTRIWMASLSQASQGSE